MSGSQGKLWVGNSNAPNISHRLYVGEKTWFAGIFVGSILYGGPGVLPLICSSIPAHFVCSVIIGIVIALFFKCVAALLNPAHRRGGPVKWGLVFYTTVMFSFLTIQTAVALHVQSISYVDNREFPGIAGVVSRGPLGYVGFANQEALNIVSTTMFFVNGWLADGLLVSSLFDTAFTRPGV